MAMTYKIGEAAELLKLKAYVLRFWETEFPDIAPLRTASGRRLYTEENIALLERIRFLLHERGLTIGGARRILAEEKARGIRYVPGLTGAVAVAPALGGGPAGVVDLMHAAGEDPGAERDDENDPDPDDVDDEAARFPYAFPSLRPDKNRSGQLNLPGLEKLLPILAGVLDNAGTAVYPAGGGSDPERNAERMLPLFVSVRPGERRAVREAGAFFGKGTKPEPAAREDSAAETDSAAERMPENVKHTEIETKKVRASEFFWKDITSELETLALMLRIGRRL
jgi:DNA-binding transcriptional MerR regulator